MIKTEYKPLKKINQMYDKDGFLTKQDGSQYIQYINDLIDEIAKLNVQLEIQQAKTEILELELGVTEE